MFYIAIGEYCWGVGETAAIAKNEARKHGPPYKKGFAVYEFADVDPPAAGEAQPVYMNDMGLVSWPAGKAKPVHVSGPDGFAI